VGEEPRAGVPGGSYSTPQNLLTAAEKLRFDAEIEKQTVQKLFRERQSDVEEMLGKKGRKRLGMTSEETGPAST
jgi:hypothetical protein